MISACQLGKRYRTGWALRPVDLSFGPGMHGLLGPNGAGKTTLIRLLAGLLRPSTGRAELLGVNVLQGGAARKKIGYVPQTIHPYLTLTAREWLSHAARLKGIAGSAAVSGAVEQTLEDVGLTAVADRRARAFSSGMIRRLGIGQAIIGSPDIIIADEPGAGLDPEERVKLRNLLAGLSMTRTVLLSTHILSDIQSNCISVAVLKSGNLAYHGPMERLARFGEGRVWTWEAAPDEPRWTAGALLLSARTTGDGILCRALAEEPPHPYAMPAAPAPEEGYIALLTGGTEVNMR